MTEQPQLFGLIGPLDQSAVDNICRQVGSMPPDTHVVVDVSRIVSDKMLFRLIQALPESMPHLRLRGLTDHQERLLRYLGFAVPQEPGRELAAEMHR